METNSILLKDVILGGKITSVQVTGNEISSIGKEKDKSGKVIDCKGLAAIPGLVNAHTHAAMTLFRNIADDLPLEKWLNEKIWPVEARLEKKDVYAGALLACTEMLKSGTTSFNDMYFYPEQTAKACNETGIRGVISEVFFDSFGTSQFSEKAGNIKEISAQGELSLPALGPHAVYTVSREGWEKVFAHAEKEKLPVHTHVSETKKEVWDCIGKNGKTPLEYLNSFRPKARIIAAHCCHLTEKEIAIAGKSGISTVNCPSSNMKLASGTMPVEKLLKARANIAIGTDGAASNNSLDMFQEMKLASLQQKLSDGNASAFSAQKVFEAATLGGAKALGINAGAIKEGMLADIALLDLKALGFIPRHNFTSALVYSTNGSCVRHVICNGRHSVENGGVENEDKFREFAQERAERLFG